MDDSSLIGAHLRSYTVVERLGVGGFGSVYRVHHDDLDVDRAIKVLHRSISSDTIQRERFLREARTSAKLRNPHIIPVYDVFEEQGLLCIVMELVSPARTLAEDLRRRGGPLPRAELQRLGREIGEALDTAHAQGVIHRDVKPQNILLTMPSGQAVLGDFGIARTTRDTGMTETGISLGTPTYMSPEQLGYGGGQVDGRSDDYSFGLVLFEAATGQQPYGTGNQAIAGHLGNKPLPRASELNPQLPPSVDAVLARALARDPGARYPLAMDLANALASALQNAPAARPAWAPPISGPTPQPSPAWTGTRPPGGTYPVTTPTQPSPPVSTRVPTVRPPVTGPVPAGRLAPRQPAPTPTRPPVVNSPSPSRGIRTPTPTGAYSPAPKRRDPWLRPFVIGGIIVVAIIVLLIIINFAVSI